MGRSRLTIKLGVAIATMSSFWLLLVALLTSSFGDWLPRRSGFARFQRWLTGTIFIMLGIRLAVPEQR